ncbi:ATP-binding protein [Streptomyces sp. NPDC019224]|uniref:ATP-binding protein n=1 Tax=Streptomyces sp. NPDC019224 TaxID=3154484 RepID=UPI0033D63032
MIGVTDTEGDRAEWSFPAVPGAVRVARHAVHDALRHWGLDSAVGDEAVLLVSELVTNSMRYTPGPIGVRLLRPHPNGDRSAARPGLLVEVSDPIPDPPTERTAGPDDESGRGLQLVARAARRWGTRRSKSGKTVWFELALPG